MAQFRSVGMMSGFTNISLEGVESIIYNSHMTLQRTSYVPYNDVYSKLVTLHNCYSVRHQIIDTRSCMNRSLLTAVNKSFTSSQQSDTALVELCSKLPCPCSCMMVLGHVTLDHELLPHQYLGGI